MKKKILIIVGILAAIVAAVILFVYIFLYVVFPIAMIGFSGTSEETLLETSESPTGEYRIQAYQINGGATSDFSVRVYLIGVEKNQLIYDAYHESEVSISWITESKVSINGRELDLSKGEIYKW